MLRNWRMFIPLSAVILLGVVLLGPLPAQDPDPGGQGQVAPLNGSDVDLMAGLFRYSGGPVKGKRAITQTAAVNLPESNAWITLPNSQIPLTVPAGTTDLFNVAFSAECRVVNGGTDDWLRIRIIDVVGGVATPLEPYDGQQAFCSAEGYATHKGNWVKRAASGPHNLFVQFWIQDNAPFENVVAWIDDWTFEVVVYD
jgi:hypothetical protein